MAARGELPIIAFDTVSAWEDWLEKNHGASPGVWVKLAKSAGGVPPMTYDRAVECALCWGWIDGQKKKLDESWWLQKFTPRGPKSVWSRINRDRAVSLISVSRMKLPGLAAVEQAKKDGRWARAYEPQSAAAVPADLQRELDRNPRARDFFATLRSNNRYAIIFRLHGARKPETRERRLRLFLQMLEEGKTIHPQSVTPSGGGSERDSARQRSAGASRGREGRARSPHPASPPARESGSSPRPRDSGEAAPRRGPR